MLGVLDRWTPTINILQTLIAQFSLHTYKKETKLAYSWSYGLGKDLSFSFDF